MSTIKDSFPLISGISPQEAAVAKRHQIPMAKGILFEKLDDGFGNPILKKVSENTVVIGGAILALEHLCNVEATWKPATLNTIYTLNNTVAGDNKESFISCFGVGTGGAGLDFGSVIKPSVKQRNVLGHIPLRTGAIVTGTDADKYFFKNPIPGGTTYNWYLKNFAAAPTIKSLWKDATEEGADGTEITTEIFDSTRTEGLETFAEYNISLNVNDIREYWASISEMDQARYNTLGLYTGQKVTLDDGSSDYVNVRLFSVVTFDNKSVKDKTEAAYSYRIYSLV